MFPQTGKAMVQILEKLGHKVICTETPACCGQPVFNTEYWDESRAIAMPMLEALKDAEAVIIGSSSCGAMMKVFCPELSRTGMHSGLVQLPQIRSQRDL
jgi:L-lactate dehydrogenase complex protein LldE